MEVGANLFVGGLDAFVRVPTLGRKFRWVLKKRLKRLVHWAFCGHNIFACCGKPAVDLCFLCALELNTSVSALSGDTFETSPGVAEK